MAEKTGQTWTRSASNSIIPQKASFGRLVMPKKDAPPPIANTLKAQREDVLGLSKKDLADLCGVSEKTIQRIERLKRGFRRITYTKVFNGINKARKKEDLKPISIRSLFPSIGEEEGNQKNRKANSNQG